jgi:thiamine transporter ThiT
VKSRMYVCSNRLFWGRTCFKGTEVNVNSAYANVPYCVCVKTFIQIVLYAEIAVIIRKYL